MKLFKMRGMRILMLVCVCGACSQEYNVQQQEKIETPYECVGRLHNEGLDFVLEKIKMSSKMTKSGKLAIPEREQIQMMCREFAQTKGYPQMSTRANDEVEERLDKPAFSKKQQFYLRKLKRIVQNGNPVNVAKLVNGIKNLESRMLGDVEFNEKERELLLYVMATCRYSACYWAEHYERWQVELYGVDSFRKSIQTRGEIVSEEWWGKYCTLVIFDGMGGIRLADGRYELEGAITASVEEYLHK